MSFRVGIDTGGTFTDLVALDEATGAIRLAKVFSTPAQPAQALLNALAEADISLSDVSNFLKPNFPPLIQAVVGKVHYYQALKIRLKRVQVGVASSDARLTLPVIH